VCVYYNWFSESRPSRRVSQKEHREARTPTGILRRGFTWKNNFESKNCVIWSHFSQVSFKNSENFRPFLHNTKLSRWASVPIGPARLWTDFQNETTATQTPTDLDEHRSSEETFQHWAAFVCFPCLISALWSDSDKHHTYTSPQMHGRCMSFREAMHTVYEYIGLQRRYFVYIYTIFIYCGFLICCIVPFISIWMSLGLLSALLYFCLTCVE